MKVDFLSCKIETKDPGWYKLITDHVGYYFLRIEKDHDNYGPIKGPVHTVNYDLLEVSEGANGCLIGYIGGLFSSDYKNLGTITGFVELDVKKEVIIQ